MEQDKRVEDKKVRFILLITQVVLWFMVMVMEMVVLIVKADKCIGTYAFSGVYKFDYNSNYFNKCSQL